MGNYIKMIVVLVGISLVSGLLLGGLNAVTQKDIEENVLRFKKVPAVMDICQGFLGELSNAEKAELEKDLLANRGEIEVKTGEGETATVEKVLYFIVKKDGKPHSIILESSGQGYGGAVGTMVGFNIQTGDFTGLGVTTHAETPGVGSRVTEASFRSQFKGMKGDSTLKTKKDGGDIDAISGATYSSRAVADSAARAMELFKAHKADIMKTIKQ